MTTANITLEWLKNPENKFSKFAISESALALINRSETLKSDILAYNNDKDVAAGISNEISNGASYQTRGENRFGYLSIGSSRFADAETTFNTLAHELGHYRVESAGAPIAVARANARAAENLTAYENACHLTEGFAHYNEVKARADVVDAIQTAANKEHRALTAQEQALSDRWTGSGDYASEPAGVEYKLVKSIEAASGAYGQLLTPDEVKAAAAFALGENNRGNNTSTSMPPETYLQYCARTSKEVLAQKSVYAGAPMQEELTTIYNDNGTVSSHCVTATSADKDSTTTIFDSNGHITEKVEIDGACNNPDYAKKVTDFDANGAVMSTNFWADNGTRKLTQIDASNTADWKTKDSTFDAQGREEVRKITFDDGSSDVIKFDAANLFTWKEVFVHGDASGCGDWQRVTNDNGSGSLIDYDQDNAYAWNMIVSSYLPGGVLAYRVMMFDNGMAVFA